ncbi:MAG: hypothetical protein JW909_11260 [Planctomycetes bacterium]|nr:hypothetical protein [Planctomycetota bacterium]
MNHGDDRLIELASAQIEDYRRMSAQMDEQEKALSEGDVERLMKILRAKNELVEAISGRDAEMRVLADKGTVVTEEARARLAELKEEAAALLEREEKSLVKLSALRSSAGQEALARAKARRAAEAYGGKHGAKEPRFLDKNE